MLKTVGNPSTRYGDQTIIDGNLIIGTSGKGIDFSATPGTGTSELLDDYEEGNWSPNQGAGLVVTGSFSSTGTYTKVGRLVTVTGTLSGSTSISVNAVGVMCTNIPFALNGAAGVGGAYNSSLTASTGTAIGGNIMYSTDNIGATSSISFSITFETN